jgi:RNA polymerase primary sigma factor
MENKEKFQEMLKDILEVARVQSNQLGMNEIKSLFGDMNLSEAQYEHIFAYLAAHHIQIKGYVSNITEYAEAVQKEELEEEEEAKKAVFDETIKANKKQSSKDSAYLQMYLEDLEAISAAEEGEEESLADRIRKGDARAKNRLIEINLRRVVDIALTYENQGITLEDLIQEGNVGLMSAMEVLNELTQKGQEKEFIEAYIKNFMELSIEEQKDSNSFENNILQRISYIRNASKELEEVLLREPTLKELAKHVKLPEEEVIDILNMSVDAVKVEHSHGKKENGHSH